MELDTDMDIDFAQYISDNEEYDTVDLTSDLEDEVDIYQGLSLVLIDGDKDFEELSDLSDNEFEEEQASPAGEPVAPFIAQSAAPVVEVPAAPEAQELNFSDHDLIAPPNTPTAPSMGVTTTNIADPDTSTTDTPEEDEPVMQGCDPAVMYVREEELKERVAKLPFPPLPATLRKWRYRQASPSMMEYIQRIRDEKVHIGQNNYKVYLPYNLRDKLIALRNWKFAIGPHSNRKFLIDEYRLRQQRKQLGSPVKVATSTT